MFASMYAAQGVGLAAPQIGKELADCGRGRNRGEKPRSQIVLANPEIYSRRRRSSRREGCLSIPGFRGYVLRPQFVTIKAQNAKGEEFEFVVKTCWRGPSAMRLIT